MGNIVIGALAGFAIYAGWVNLPPMWGYEARLAGFALGLVIVLSAWLGRRTGRAKAVAIATAKADARAAAAAAAESKSQAASSASVTFNLGGPQAEAARARFEGYDHLPWIGETKTQLEQDASEVEEMDLEQMSELRERHTDAG